MDRVRVLAPTLLAAFALLGEQGARVTTVDIPRISFSWVVLLLAASFLLTRNSDGRRLGVRDVAVAVLLGAGFFAMTLWRDQALRPPLSLVVTLDGQQELVAESLQFEARRDLRRLAGRRRNVTLRADALIEIPRDGDYHFNIACDDSCSLLVGETRIRNDETVRLEGGELNFSLDYRQLAGPAKLRFAWNTPAPIELLPMEYFLRAPGGADRGAQRWRAHTSLVLALVWWGCLSAWLSRIAPFRLQVSKQRWVPVTGVAILVLYGSLLRYDALLVHTGDDAPLPLQQWVPSYGVFNPAGAPEDPYRADVRSYLERAESFTWSGFYAPSFREPFYIALCMPFLALAGGEVGILLQSLFFSCATLALFGFMVAKMHGLWWGPFLLLPVALHEWLVLEAPSGYRMSAYSFFLLATVAVMFSRTTRSRSAVLTGALAGMLCLIRLSALSVVVPLVILRAWSLTRDERLRYAGIVLALLVAIVGPFLASNAWTHGDPFYSISFHTEFWMRAEGIDSSQGPVSWTRYFTDFGRAGTLLKGTVLGMTTLPIRTFWNGLRLFPLLDAFVIALGIIGLIACARAKQAPKRIFVTAAYFAHLVPFAYIQNFPSGQMPRFVMPSYFFLVLAAPAAVGWLVKSYRQRQLAQF